MKGILFSSVSIYRQNRNVINNDILRGEAINRNTTPSILSFLTRSRIGRRLNVIRILYTLSSNNKDEGRSDALLRMGSLSEYTIRGRLDAKILVKRARRVLTVNGSLMGTTKTFTSLTIRVLGRIISVLPYLVILMTTRYGRRVNRIYRDKEKINKINNNSLTLRNQIRRVLMTLSLSITSRINISSRSTTIRRITNSGTTLILMNISSIYVINKGVQLPRILINMRRQPKTTRRSVYMKVILLKLSALSRFTNTNLSRLSVSTMFLLGREGNNIRRTLEIKQMSRRITTTLYNEAKDNDKDDNEANEENTNKKTTTDTRDDEDYSGANDRRRQAAEGLFRDGGLRFLPRAFQ